MKRVTIDVARELMNRNALLLPAVHDMLHQYTSELLRKNNLESTDVTKLATSRWVLSSLTGTLKNHIAYKCTVRMYGTLIYRPNMTLACPRDQRHHSLRLRV